MKKTLSFLAAALMCVAVNAQTAFSENFESVDAGSLPAGWTVYADNLTNSSNYQSFNQSWSVATLGSEKVAASISWTEPQGNDCDRWLITPAITVPSDEYSLYFRVWGYTESYPEKVRVMLSTTGTQKTDFTTTLGDIVMDGNNYSADWNDILFDLSAYDGQTIYIAFVNHGDGYYTLLDDVSIEIFDENAIRLTNVTAPGYAAMGNAFDVNVTVQNRGTANLTSFDVTFNINNGTDQELHVSGINVAPFSYYTYTFSTSHPDAELVAVYVTVSNPNGIADADDSDNGGSVNLTVYDPQYVTDRNPLLEHFTTAQCVWCPAGHDRLNQAIVGYESRISWVAHHVGFGTDALTCSASTELTTLYGPDGTWAPAMALDRDQHFVTAEQSGVVGSVGDVATLRQQFADAVSIPSIVTVNIENLTYDQTTRELSFNVNGEFLSDFTGDVANLTIYITEDSIISRQSHNSQGTINDYQHNHVVRAALTPNWGDSDPFTTTLAGSTYSKTYTYTLPTKLRANKCRVIAFVNNYGPSILKREVYNSAKTGYLMVGQDPTNVAITSVEASISVKSYPNPATEMVFVSAESTIRSFSMVNTLGQTVMSDVNVNTDVLELNVADLAAGVYYIKVVTDKGTATESVTVVK